MTKDEEWLDEKFDELRSRGASCSKSFSDELEVKIMQERLNAPSSRRKVWTIAIAILTIGVAGGAYASNAALKNWIFGPFHAESDGTIRDADGEKIGEDRVLEDGTKQFSVQVGDTQIVADGHLPEGTSSFSFEPIDGSAVKVPDDAGKTIDK